MRVTLTCAIFLFSFKEIVAQGTISLIAGSGSALGDILTYPSPIAVSSAGDVFVADPFGSGNSGLIRRIDHATGLISIFAGGGSSSADGASAATASIRPIRLAFDNGGNLLFSEGNRIRLIDMSSGLISTLAGTSVPGFGGDGSSATAGQLSAGLGGGGIAVDSDGNLFIADTGNLRVRKVDAKTGIITTVAGNGAVSYSGEGGPATQASINAPLDVAVGKNGELYIASVNTYRVMRVDANGIISTFAGNGSCGYSGDGGLAVLASLCQPDALAVDDSGNLFVADNNGFQGQTNSHCICVRRIADTGIIQTIAGGGSGLAGASGLATSASFTGISSITVGAGTLYITEATNAGVSDPRIWSVTPAAPPPLSVAPGSFQILNSGSFAGGLSPGEIVSLIGNYLGPSSPTSSKIGPNGRVATSLAGVQVLFNGVPAPLLYTSAAQINAIIPYQTPVGVQVQVQVRSSTGQSPLESAYIDPASLGIFNGAVVNPDGTLNSQTNPAPQGATLVFYGTGMGQTKPPGIDGAVVQGPNLPVPVNTFSALVSLGTGTANRLPAQIAYLGPAPGFVSGVVQMNIVIPTGLPSGPSVLSLAPGSGTGYVIYIH